MSVLDFLRPAKKGSPASQIAALESSLQRLRGELKSANETAEAYAPKRAEMLLSDSTEEDILALDKQAEMGRLRLERLELAEMALLEQIEAARDSADRTRKASELERAAASIEAKTQAVDAAAAAFAAAYRDMLATIPADLIELQARKLGFTVDVAATPADIAGAIAAQALAAACPELFETRAPVMRTWGAAIEKIIAVKDIDRDGRLSPVLMGEHGDTATISNADKAADRIIIDRLRAQAARLRDSTDMRQAAE
jgi:hypothetical protein